MSEGSKYVSATIIPESSMNITRAKEDKYFYENFDSKLPLKKDLVADPQSSDYFRQIKDDTNSSK